MRRRLYFLMPSIRSARQAVNELLLARIDDHHIHVMARDDIDLSDLPQASLLQKSDFIHAIEQGLIVGGLTGIFAGIVLWVLPSVPFGPGWVLGLALIGAIMGVWISGMIGVDVPNSRLRLYEKPIEQGELLVMADIPKERVEEVTSMVKRHYPEADMYSVDPTIPAFP